MNKIQRVSMFFRVLFQVLFVTLPVLELIGWTTAPEPLSFFAHIVEFSVIPNSYPILHTLSNTERMMGFMLDLTTVSIELVTLYFLIKLFRLYEAGEIFSLNNVRYIRNIGYALLAGQLFSPVHQLLMGLVLTLNNPHGHRFIAVTFKQNNVGILLMSLLVILVSWIMAEGCRLREEQLLTV